MQVLGILFFLALELLQQLRQEDQHHMAQAGALNMLLNLLVLGVCCSPWRLATRSCSLMPMTG